jgi:hypothetical protein
VAYARHALRHHAEVADGRFSFTLQIFHPRLGLLVRQMALFREIEP